MLKRDNFLRAEEIMTLSLKRAMHLSWVGMFMTSAIATSVITPVRVNANPNLLLSARRACEQVATNRGYRVVDMTQPFVIGNSRAETTLTLRDRRGGGWNREEIFRCEYNGYNGQVYLDRGYANNPGNPGGPWGGRPGEPRLLGETRLAFEENDVDGINVPNCQLGVRQIQIRARRAPIDLKFVQLRFGNGEVDRLTNLPSSLRPRESTGWIDLPGGNRCLKRITIKGDTRDFARQEGVVEIWGR
jgi:hypothetical protein